MSSNHGQVQARNTGNDTVTQTSFTFMNSRSCGYAVQVSVSLYLSAGLHIVRQLALGSMVNMLPQPVSMRSLVATCLRTASQCHKQAFIRAKSSKLNAESVQYVMVGYILSRDAEERC